MAAFLAFSLFSVAFAQEENASASLPLLRPTEIGTLEELMKIGVDPAYPLDAEYSLTADISGKGAEFMPIGSEDAPFSGTFHGNGHRISELKIDAQSAGLFGMFSGKVDNLTLSGFDITGNTAGVFAAQVAAGAQLSGLFVTGTLRQKEGEEPFTAGGLAGRVQEEAALVEKTCAFVQIVPADGSKLVGAFVGDNAAASEIYRENIWSSAYSAGSAFGVDSAVSGSDGVLKIEPGASYFTLAQEGHAQQAKGDEAAAEQYGLRFKGFSCVGENVITLGAAPEATVALIPGAQAGAAELISMYERVYADGMIEEVRFSTPVIVSGKQEAVDPAVPLRMDEEETKIDPVLPAQMEEQPQIDHILPTRWVS